MEKLFDRTKYTEQYITDEGKIFRLSLRGKNKGLLTPRKANYNKSRGYYYIRTKNRNYGVHRLVAQHFIENPRNKPCVNHIDGNRLNNHKNNLEWVSHKENTIHAERLGLTNYFKKNEGANLKYTNEQCKGVIENVKLGMTYREAGKPYSMPYSTVAHLIGGRIRKIC